MKVRLDCRENELRAIPRSVGACLALAELYLGQNHLTILPEEIGDCAALRTLDLARNRLRALPAVLGKIPLGLLDASGNELTSVAPELGHCITLRRLVLDGNPLRSIRQNLLTGPTVDLLAHLRSKLPEDLGPGQGFAGVGSSPPYPAR
jgi:Leucine-rich repeat (LRR) protein